MPRPLSVHLLPALFAEDDVTGGDVVIVDILRASTTITHALANGAKEVVPLQTVEEAFEFRKSRVGDRIVLGGERGGIKVEGFDYGNSPRDYVSAHVAGKSVGFTTTNGTRALLRSQRADEILVGCFSNFSTVVSRLLKSERPIHIVCAGTDGCITGEDVLFAGAIVKELSDSDVVLNDEARIATDFWNGQVAEADSERIEYAMRQAQGGRNLIKLGYDADIALAAAVDSVPVLGGFRNGRIGLIS